MRPEDPDGLAALDEQSLVLAEPEQRPHDRPERVMGARGTPRPAVHDELLGVLGDLAVEVVEQHPQRRLRLPRACIQRQASWCADCAEVAAENLDEILGHCSSSLASTGSTASTCRARSRKRHHDHRVAATK